jgi:hypothetical protein
MFNQIYELGLKRVSQHLAKKVRKVLATLPEEALPDANDVAELAAFFRTLPLLHRVELTIVATQYINQGRSAEYNNWLGAQFVLSGKYVFKNGYLYRASDVPRPVAAES